MNILDYIYKRLSLGKGSAMIGNTHKKGHKARAKRERVNRKRGRKSK